MQKEIIRIEQNELPVLLENPQTLLLDVRETWEFRDFNIGGVNIPPHEITDRLAELQAFDSLVIACSNGTRSEIVARLLQKKIPQKQIYHLEEGIF